MFRVTDIEFIYTKYLKKYLFSLYCKVEKVHIPVLRIAERQLRKKYGLIFYSPSIFTKWTYKKNLFVLQHIIIFSF